MLKMPESFLNFSEGGYRSRISCCIGTFYHLCYFQDFTRPVAAQGFILKSHSGSFSAEPVALEAAASVLISWLVPAAS